MLLNVQQKQCSKRPAMHLVPHTVAHRLGSLAHRTTLFSFWDGMLSGASRQQHSSLSTIFFKLKIFSALINCYLAYIFCHYYNWFWNMLYFMFSQKCFWSSLISPQNLSAPIFKISSFLVPTLSPSLLDISLPHLLAVPPSLPLKPGVSQVSVLSLFSALGAFPSGLAYSWALPLLSVVFSFGLAFSHKSQIYILNCQMHIVLPKKQSYYHLIWASSSSPWLVSHLSSITYLVFQKHHYER